MSQSRAHSMIEAWTNVAVGFGVAMLANVTLFPLFGWHISGAQNIALTCCFTVISLVRSYLLRRLFNRWHT